LDELSSYSLDMYFVLGGTLDALNWRTKAPQQLYAQIAAVVQRRLG